MTNHLKIYLDHFGYDVTDFVPCEYCGKKMIDPHHLSNRGMGGNPTGLFACVDCESEIGSN